MQVSTRSFFRQQSENLQDLKGQIVKLQDQVSSGKQLTVPSEDPVAFSSLSMLKAKGARIEQFQRNIEAGRQHLNLEDNTLSQVANALTRIRELSVQAQNDTLTSNDRKSVGGEIRVLSDMIFDLANTTDTDGKPIFAGAIVDQAPFDRNADGSVTYRGDSTKIAQYVNDSTSVTVNNTGDDVFMKVATRDGSRKSIFEIVDNVAKNLEQGLPPGDGLADVVSSLDSVTSCQTITGARMATLDSETTRLSADKLATSSHISVLEDTDIEKAITELKQKLTSIDAAQSAFVKIADLSLFNYLR